MFEPGQKVLIKFDYHELNKSKKLANKYRGPFTIIEKLTDVNYRVELIILRRKKEIEVIHVQRIKPFYETGVLPEDLYKKKIHKTYIRQAIRNTIKKKTHKHIFAITVFRLHTYGNNINNSVVHNKI